MPCFWDDSFHWCGVNTWQPSLSGRRPRLARSRPASRTRMRRWWSTKACFPLPLHSFAYVREGCVRLWPFLAPFPSLGSATPSLPHVIPLPTTTSGISATSSFTFICTCSSSRSSIPSARSAPLARTKTERTHQYPLDSHVNSSQRAPPFPPRHFN